MPQTELVIQIPSNTLSSLSALLVFLLITEFINVSGDSCNFVGGGHWGRLGA